MWHFEPPLKRGLDEMRDSCVEEMIDVTVSKRSALTALRQMIDENCTIVDDMRLGDDDAKIHKGAKLLPKKSLNNKVMKNAEQLDQIEQLRLPAHFLFSYAKGEITSQKIKHMQSTHLECLRRIGKHLGAVVKECQDFFEEVAVDIEAFGAMENSMPSPPPVTHLYLKYCEGREVAEDARTPRIEEIQEELDEAAGVNMSKSFNPSESNIGQGKHAGSMANVRLEKNRVLSNANKERNERSQQKAGRGQAMAAGSTMNFASMMSMNGSMLNLNN